MKDTQKNGKLALSAAADKDVVPAGKPGERILEIKLMALEVAEERPRLPLNIALVLDRSGSMHGEKLYYARQAAAHVIDLLGDDDSAAVVVYDNRVNLLLPPQIMTPDAKQAAKEKISQIQSGGSTFLFGGWMTGCQQLAEVMSNQSFNRVLLLTDGLANVGERNVDRLAFHTHELFMRGISTSCFGVGQGYDEHLLEAMANHGGGSFHFLETLQAIPLVFEREFDEIINVALHDLEMTLDLPSTVKASVSANWHHTRQDGHLKVFLGSLPAGREQMLYLQLSNLTAIDEGGLTLTCKALGKDHEQRVHEARANLTFTAVDAKQEAAHPQDEELMKRFAVVELADKANEALKREREGDRVGSAQIMRDAAYLYKQNINESTFDKYQQLSEDLSQGMDQVQRKRQHFREYEAKRGWQSIRDYQLRLNNGVPILEIEDQSVLINTAALVSIGCQPSWVLLNELYKLPSESNGLSCDGLADVLGTQVDVMLGMDILRDLFLVFDGLSGLAQISRTPLRASGVRLPLKMTDGFASTTLTINGKGVSMRLATVLKLNYVPANIAANLNPIGSAKDSLLTGSAFETPLYKLTIPIGRHHLALNFGGVTDELRQALSLEEGEGVLGADLLQTLPVTLAFPDREAIMYV